MASGIPAAMSGTAPVPGAVQQIDEAERELYQLSVEAQRADWVYNTYVNSDSEAISAAANARLISRTVALAKRLSKTPGSPSIPPTAARKVRLLRVSLPMVAPSEGNATEELTRIVNRMQGVYAKGRHALIGGSEPLDLQALSRILAEKNDPTILEDAWVGWHKVGRTMRSDFARYVELANQGSRELGFEDTGAMWRSRYDMTPEEFRREVERLWLEVRPLYQALHTFVRRSPFRTLRRGCRPQLGADPRTSARQHVGPILGQSLLSDRAAGIDPGYDLTKILTDRGTSPPDMVRYAERFFVSLGLDPLPESFWQRSMFVRPRDREVVCHASAWDIDFVDDLRIKMCIEVTGEDFHTIHHELGHNYYQRAYSRNRSSSATALTTASTRRSGTPLPSRSRPSTSSRSVSSTGSPTRARDIGLLLQDCAREGRLPPVRSGRSTSGGGRSSPARSPPEYNAKLVGGPTGVPGHRPPAPRTEEEFDPGAKFHVPANVPYMRYFLAHILQFQFHQALARAIQWKGPLHRCSIYGRKEAGERLNAMLRLGASHEWPDALEAITGERRMSSEGLREYFRPLERWLNEQNRGQKVGW